MTEYGVPGVAFGVVKNGQATVRGFGVTNVEEPQPVTQDTVFGLASISKTVTATALTLSGAQAGNYSLNTTTATTTANITAAQVTPAITVSNKTYDGTIAATLTACSLAGVAYHMVVGLP